MHNITNKTLLIKYRQNENININYLILMNCKIYNIVFYMN
jgi:hypothetical protein